MLTNSDDQNVIVKTRI